MTEHHPSTRDRARAARPGNHRGATDQPAKQQVKASAIPFRPQTARLGFHWTWPEALACQGRNHDWAPGGAAWPQVNCMSWLPAPPTVSRHWLVP